MSHVPACTQCGACCFSTLDTYVRVLGDDYARFGDGADRVSVFIGNRCYMRMLNGHCAQLAVDAAGRFICGMYEQRPEVCRTLERGSDVCAGERERKAERAVHAVASLFGLRPGSGMF
jgi:Fe-S-cluster containining protein